MKPSVSTPVWQTEGAAKRQSVQRMFAEIAPSYDRVNGILSLSLHTRWRAAAVQQLGLRPGDRALDLCTGTGDFLRPLLNAVGEGGSVIGADFCLPMLEGAQEKHLTRDGLVLADASSLPFQDGVFDAVTVGWGIRNVPDIDQAHREIARVLKPGGRFASLDMARPRGPLLAGISRFVFHTVSPMVGRLLGKSEAYTYLPKSTDRFWSREELSESMRKAGFNDVRTQDFMLGNICLHLGTKS